MEKIKVYNPWIVVGMYITGEKVNQRLKRLGLIPVYDKQHEKPEVIMEHVRECNFIIIDISGNSPSIETFVSDIREKHTINEIDIRKLMNNKIEF